MEFWARRASWLICGLLAAGFFPPRSSPSGDGAPRTQATDIAQKHLLTFVAAPLPGNPTAQGAPSFYGPNNLYEYMDGGADVYLLYDFQVLLHQDFKSGQAELTVDIFDMGNAEDAFGMYAAERAPGYNFLDIGIEAYRNEGILNFLQDRYYIKLAGFGPGSDDLLERFARVLSERIAGTREFPPLLERIPQEHRVKHSEQFTRKDPLGHPFLSPAYVVSYGQGELESKLLISVAKDAAEAKSKLESLAKYFRESGKCEAAPDLGDGAIQADNSFEGHVIAVAQGRYLIVILNPANDAAVLLKKTIQDLK
ncbi:MAG TPA: DUF6599 family protein [Candidatus Acidoferrum sp.]|nr:DUF6599 family protein [Candidatus Acidoferrum sp.]